MSTEVDETLTVVTELQAELEVVQVVETTLTVVMTINAELET